MNAINLVVFVLLSFLSWASFRLARLIYGDYFAPLGIFLGVNLASLALNQLRLLPFVPLSAQTWLLVVASLFSFIFGAILATPSLVLVGKGLCQKMSFDRKSLETSEGLSLFFYFTTFLGIAGWIFYITVLVPPEWVEKPWLLQGEYIFPYHLGYTLVAGTLGAPAFVLLTLAKGRISFPAVCLLLINILALAICGIKAYLVVSIVISFLIWSSLRQRTIRLRHFLVVAALLVGFMVLYDRFIDVFVPHQFPDSKFPAALSFLERPYLYIAGPWSAMSVVMADPPPQAHWGQVTLLPLWKLLGPGGFELMERVPKYLPFVNIGPSDFNVYSLIGEVYWDFGWLGSILICFLLGFISTRLYLIALRQRDWVWYLISSVFSYGLAISFFAYYYRDNLLFLLLYTLTIGKLSKQASMILRFFMGSVALKSATAEVTALGRDRR